MKSKIIITLQTIMMYLLLIPVLGLFLTLIFPIDNDNLIETLFKLSFIGHLIMIPIIIISLIFAFLNFKNKNTKSLFISTLVNKIVLIPWYIVNFIYSIVIVAGFLNPFMIWGIPIVIAILMLISYVYLVSTSLHLCIYKINRLIRKKEKISAKTIVGIILLFIFCLDIIGTILLKDKKEDR